MGSIDSPECKHHWALMNPEPCPRCQTERVAPDLVEAMARAMWEIWRTSAISPQLYHGITWNMILDGAKTNPKIAELRDVGFAEAKAALAVARPQIEAALLESMETVSEGMAKAAQDAAFDSKEGKTYLTSPNCYDVHAIPSEYWRAMLAAFRKERGL